MVDWNMQNIFTYTQTSDHASLYENIGNPKANLLLNAEALNYFATWTLFALFQDIFRFFFNLVTPLHSIQLNFSWFSRASLIGLDACYFYKE